MFFAEWCNLLVEGGVHMQLGFFENVKPILDAGIKLHRVMVEISEHKLFINENFATFQQRVVNARVNDARGWSTAQCSSTS